MNTSRRTFRLALALLAPVPALAEQVPPSSAPQSVPWHWAGPPMWHAGWGLWWIFPLFMFLMMVGFVVLAVRGWRSGGGPMHCGPWHASGGGAPPGDDATRSALRILHERFARGELQKAQYEEMRALIEGRAPAGPA